LVCSEGIFKIQIYSFLFNILQKYTQKQYQAFLTLETKMKKLFLFCAIFASHSLFGFYAGVGFGINTIDENFKSNLSSSEDRSGKDHYNTHKNRWVPMVTLGHQFNFCGDWLVDLSAEWKYINYKTCNVGSSRGQILPNATFSSINFFGPEVLRDFTSITRLNNEVLLLASIGKEVCSGIVYFGIGPVVFNGSNTIYVSSIHTPNGTGDHLTSGSVKANKTLWGGAARIAYRYFLNENYFINIGYTYMQTGSAQFKNTANAAELNGFDTPGPTTLFLKRSIKFTVQELIVSMNLAF
jgi:hypothetical protein